MSEAPRKRVAESQMSRDDDGEDRADESFITTPQIADAAELASRRMVRIRRPQGGAEQSANASTNAPSFFKFVPSPVHPSEGESKPTFGFGVSTGAPKLFSFGTSTSTSGAPKPTSGAPLTEGSTSSSLSSFTFGNPAAAGPAPSSTPSATGFSLDSATNATSGSKAAFSFNTAPTEPVKPLSGFSFGLPSEKAVATATSAVPTTADTSENASKPQLFGAGSFNFKSAVNSFVEARKKMQEEKKDSTGSDPCAKHDAVEDKNGDKGDYDGGEHNEGGGFGSEIVEQSARDVLASAPSKLFLFEKGEGSAPGRWVERGAGEAKLIAQEKKDDAATRVYRLLVRGGYALNATLGKNLFTLSKTEAKHLLLTVATTEGPHTYLLKFTGASAEANTTKFSSEITRIMQQVETSA